MAERLRRAQAAKRNLEAALPAEQRRERLQLVLRRWGELAAAAEYAPALARLLPPARIAAAEHLLARHGERVLEQPRFMAEFGQTLAVFGDRAATPLALERADLASRHALPPEDRPPLEQYGPASAAAVRTYEAEALAALEAEFARDGNPLHAWEALALAASGDQPVPAWVLHYLTAGAEKLAAIRQEVAAGKPVDKEAERAGKALGFGTTGAGRGSRFTAKAMLERDREYYFAVVAAVEKGTKLHRLAGGLARHRREGDDGQAGLRTDRQAGRGRTGRAASGLCQEWLGFRRSLTAPFLAPAFGDSADNHAYGEGRLPEQKDGSHGHLTLLRTRRDGTPGR
jgi:hypothetical protein